jgi:hypothetical protein
MKRKFCLTESFNHLTPAEIIQSCMADDGKGWTYDKEELLLRLQSLSDQDFINFCNTVRELQEFKDANEGAWATDRYDTIPKNFLTMYWQLR